MPDFLKGTGAARIGAMAGVAAALTGFFLYIFGAISEPPRAILFSGLDPRDAGQVTQKLDAMQVPYDTKGDGGTILIAGDQVTKVRMQLASEGLPSAGVGYEIFDKSDSFGTTAFVQNINRLRALEGELSRSIKTIEGIESVRVHLVVPERQVFARDNQPPSASVMIKAHARLSRGQVSAVQHLVAAAVSGMQPNSVAIVDDQGELLSPGPGDTGDAAASAQQDEQSTQFEDRIRERVETMVASIVGPGHVRAQISAELDFNRVTEQTETFDPDSKVVRSSQTTEETSNDRSASGGGAVSVGNALPGQQAPQGDQQSQQGSANSRTQETLNYEISHTSRTQVREPGAVKRISVGVVVDGNWGKADANGIRAYTPRTAAEMAQITALVRSAIGFNQQRGDTVQVTNMKFAQVDLPPQEPESEPLLGIDNEVWLKWGEVFLLCLTALLVFFFIVRPMIRRLTTPIGMNDQLAIAGSAPGQQAALTADGHANPAAQAQGQIAGQSQQALPAPARRESMIDISQIEGQVRESAIRKVGEVVTAHPEEAMAILRTWLHEPA